MRLENKVAIITGAASGLGFESAKRFMEEGAKVALADFDEKVGNESVEELQGKGGIVEFFKVDVANRDSVDSMVKNVVDKFGTVDILINNAGITRDAMLTKMSVENFQKVIDVNLTGVFHCTQAVVPYMIEKGKGKIISTSSVSGVYGNIGQTNYAASKAAVVGMTKTWAKELARKGINVNAVVPGFIATNMVKSMPEKVINNLVKTIPAQELGKPEDIANAYLYLASDEARYVHGTALHVDGGIMM
ncbi:3-oxoacyl-ACP reductase FabG [Priestia filamentosa]|uniref:glucose 1-dehydrogenase [NAD(P)(+)] n=1 Tax=Priestia filamentosa TaxID=1402861 RepID=A0A1X7FHY2_9BACI|nr:3-oxoacyl-ACP reductase FabG [Priestia filamentosa]AKO91270.1 3-oxoacyl-[acyl-carrier-protein] reductase [Priestia filamentosa]MDT3765373.1 3-oxoacyl-ACP reductase FabG [Priestia filamentosa]OXS67143.1 beta-ketoacyl-ACP reductase [Priestia filamentosa]WRU95867.1 3-oxoacyl-ACP reductase FabG [Priestia filamentosa]SMF52306.1 3-oxoacyl-[acyl-carrier-protein] reductase [Priestia filamentosa]